MKVVVMFIIVAPGLSLQRDSCSGEQEESRRHGHKKRTSREELASGELDATNEKYNRYATSHRRAKEHLKRHRMGYSGNCFCDCNNCDDLQQCCQPTCSSECEQPELYNQVEQPGVSPGNLVFVPYPYPLVVPPPAPPMPMLPIPIPTTVRSITTSTALSINNYDFRRRHSEPLDKDSYFDLLRTLRDRKELPFSRDRLSGMRPVKRYIPEYGMISDHLIDRLMSQVRNVKDIQSTMDH